MSIIPAISSKTQRALIAFSVLSLTTLGCLAQSKPCVTYHYDEAINISGRIIKKTFAGPPNYESIKNGDRPETYLVLKLDQPICLGKTPGDDLNEAAENINLLQLLIADDAQHKAASKLVGQTVVVSGSFFSAQSGHHHTPVLLELTQIRACGAESDCAVQTNKK